MFKRKTTENYKTLLKEAKEDQNKWKDSSVHGLEDLIDANILQINLQIQCNPYQNPHCLFKRN